MNSYSPTQTSRYTRCPTMWWLYRQGWEPRNVYKNSLAAIAGSAFHVWAHDYYKSGRRETSPLVAAAFWDQSVEDLRGKGHVIYAEDELIRYPALVEKGIEKYPSVDPIPLSWNLTAFEEEMDDGSRIDLGGYTNTGLPFYLDFKVTTYCKEEDIQKRVQDYLHSWQAYHYSWAYSRKLGVPVRRFYIVFVVLNPRFQVVIQDFEIDPEIMERWEASAERHWHEITQWRFIGDVDPAYVRKKIPMVADHKDGWGKCQYYNFCFTYKLDPVLAEAEYIQIERIKK